MIRHSLKRELRPSGLSALLLGLYLCLAPALLLAQEEGEAAAVVPPAPARLLTTTVCPSASESLAPMSRATKSATPSGGTVTTS